MRDFDVDKKNFYSPLRVDYAFSKLPQIYRDNIEDRLFHRAEEMYEAAIFLAGCYVLDTSNQYSMRSYEGETPDVLAVKRNGSNEKGRLWAKTNIEIVTLRDFDPRTNIKEFLDVTKFSKKKAYNENDTILLSLMKTMRADLGKLVKEIAIDKPAAHVFALGKFKEQRMGDFFVARLYPNAKTPVSFNFQHILDILPTPGKLNLLYNPNGKETQTSVAASIDDPFEVLGLLDQKKSIIQKYGGL